VNVQPRLRAFALAALATCSTACEGDAAGDDPSNVDPDAAISADEGPATDPDATPGTTDAEPPAQDTDAATPPDAALPPIAPMEAPVDAPGPWRIGYRESEVVYVGSADEQPRVLRLALWYPTEDESGEPSSYLLGRISRPEVFRDANVAFGRFPVVLFSHGSGGLAEQSVFLTERLASHGFVVAAPDHTGNTFTNGSDFPPEMFFQRPEDLSATLDALYDGTNGLEEDPLVGTLTDDVAVIGHSFGAYTSLAITGMGFRLEVLDAACAASPDDLFCQVWVSGTYRDLFAAGLKDPRITASVPMAPLGGPAFDFSAIDVPTLLITAGLDATLPPPGNGDDVWRGLDGADDLRLDFPEAGHFSFADICEALPGAVRGDGCGDGFTPTPEIHTVANTYTLAFLRKHLFGDTRNDGLLSGDPAPADIAVLSLP
jgi:predicted dienelactone hydrolase